MKTEYAAILNLVEEANELLPLTKRRPVATLPFGCRYRLIDFPFSSLFNAKVGSAALFISGSGRSLYDHIRSGSTWGLDNVSGGGVFTHSQLRLKERLHGGLDKYYYEDHKDYVSKSKGDYVVLLGSSILVNLQIDSVLDYHRTKNSHITVAYKKMPRDEFKKDTIYSSYQFIADQTVEIEKIVPLNELPYDSNEIFFGLDFLIADKHVFLDYLDRLKEQNEYVTVENILKLALDDEDTCVNGYEYTGYLKAIEDISSYFEANMDMLDEDKFNALFYREAPVLTKSKNSAPTYYGESSNVVNAIIANDNEIYGEVKDSLIFRRNFICQDAKIKNSILLQGSFVDEGADLEYVILDKGVHVEKGATLKGTRENPIVVPKKARILSSGEVVEG